MQRGLSVLLVHCVAKAKRCMCFAALIRHRAIEVAAVAGSWFKKNPKTQNSASTAMDKNSPQATHASTHKPLVVLLM